VAERLERDKKTIGEEALSALARHGWPGNVRELRNAIEQALVLSPGSVIGPEDLRITGGPVSEPSKSPVQVLNDVPFRDAKRHAVESFERDYLVRALRAHDGNISRTAESIGMVRQSLQQKIRELGLRSEEWNGDA
jgi:DNA-binding NtrC family response regulator